jgi:hypothetical protein
MSDSQKISFEDISFTNMLQVEALLLLLIRKGIITKDEYQLEVEKVHQTYLERSKLRDAKNHPDQ